MSRFFQPVNRAGNEFLIESIELLNEREKAKEQKRKEKKEKKKEKKDDKRKDKKKDRNQSSQSSDVTNSQNLEHDCPVTKGKLFLKGKEPQIEQLEGSSLTEDHLLPPVRFDIPSTSSDSTNSHKRKRNSFPLNESPGHGNKIRVKLSSKQNESNAFANANEMRPCSKSGNTNAVKMEDSNNNLKFGRENSSPTLEIDRGQILSTSQHVEGVTKGKSVYPSVPKAPRNNSYNNLRYGRENSSPALKIDRGQISSTSQPVEGVTKGKSVFPSVPKAPRENSNNNSALKIDGEQICSTSQPVGSVNGKGLTSVRKAPKDGYNIGRENSSSIPKNVGEKLHSTFQPVESVGKAKNGIPSVPKAPKDDSCNNLRYGRENSMEGVTKRKCEIPSVPKVPKGNSNYDVRDGRENSADALKIAGEKICSTSQTVEGVTKGNIGILSMPKVPKAVTSHLQREELRYNELFGNLSLPQLQNQCLDDEDLDWLLRNPAEKRQKTQNDGISCSNSFALTPRAQLLNGFDIYALPFTVLF